MAMLARSNQRMDRARDCDAQPDFERVYGMQRPCWLVAIVSDPDRQHSYGEDRDCARTSQQDKRDYPVPESRELAFRPRKDPQVCFRALRDVFERLYERIEAEHPNEPEDTREQMLVAFD